MSAAVVRKVEIQAKESIKSKKDNAVVESPGVRNSAESERALLNLVQRVHERLFRGSL